MSKKKAYVIGTNVSASLSPTIFKYWFEKYNINAEYGFVEVKEENFDRKIQSILKEDDLCGLNITIPYKEKIIPHLTAFHPVNHTSYPKNLNATEDPKLQDRTQELNEIISLPVNCVSISGDEIIGKNTDCIGFEKALNTNPKYLLLKESQRNKEHLIAAVLGYGGAAKAIIRSLVAMDYSQIFIINRTFEKIKNLKHIFKKNNTHVYSCSIEPLKIEDLHNIKLEKLTLIANTAPTNMLVGSHKLNQRYNILDTIGFDAVYKPKEGSGFLENFEPNNRIEGIQMLVYQAAPCLYEWFGVEPEIDDDLFKTLYAKMKEQ